MKGVIPCGCGQCMPCRINKSRMWSHRIMLETVNSSENTFVTLTYRDEELEDYGDWVATRPVVGNLEPKKLQRWFKRLRRFQQHRELRYFAVGEYGDQKGRPHYHIALFGFPNCVYGRTKRNSRGRCVAQTCCQNCNSVQQTWPFGDIELGELNKDTAQYIAGYVTKKWTKEDSWTKNKLKGRHPEFARMSLKPGIGAPVIKNVISFTGPTRVGKYVRACLDAPVVLRNSGSLLPLGRYLRRKWREALGRSEDTPESVLGEYCQEMQRVYGESKEKESLAGTPSCFISPKSVYQWSNRQKILNLDSKTKIRQNRRTL